MVLVKSLVLRGTADFGKAKAELDDVAARARKVGEMSPTVNLKVDDGAATLKLRAFAMELRSLRESGNQAGLSDLAGRLKSFGNEAASSKTKMHALKLESDALTASMSGSGGRGGLAGAAGQAESGAAGLAGPSGMGALIGAGATLAPIVTTLGIGLGGLGLAAAGTIMPIEKAAAKTGGLSKNLDSLDAEQKTVAKGVLGLGQEYKAFQKSLEPQVVGAFGQAIKIAGHLMTDVLPVAKATGTAFDTFLGQFGDTLQDPRWKQFWGFMARTAPQDMQLLGDTLISLANDLPPLLEGLQPVGVAVLTIGDDAAKALGPLIRLTNNIENSPLGSRGFFAGVKSIDALTVKITDAIPGARSLNNWITSLQHSLSGAGGAAKTGTPAVDAFGRSQAYLAQVAKHAGNSVSVETDQVKNLTGAFKALDSLLGDQSAQIAWKQAQQQANSAINAGSKALDGNSKASLANRQKVVDATQKATAYANEQVTVGHNVNGASKTLQNQIDWLRKSGDKSDWMRRQIRLLEAALRDLRDYTVRITVSGQGTWTMHNPRNQSLPGGFPGGVGAAAGMLVRGGVPGRDSVLVKAAPGELIVPAPIVGAGAVDHLRGLIPGFAAGGVVGRYGDGVPGLRRWEMGDIRAAAASERALMARAVVAAIHQAQASFASRFGGSGAVGGDPAANRALARRMFPWPAYMWPDQDLLWTRESGWNRYAYNASSGATGIPQALPHTKMPRAAWLPFQGGQAAAGAQIGWGYGYERQRYGTPLRAWGHEMAYGWYDDGKGWLPPGLSLALNTTGKPEPVGRGGNTYNITVKVPVSANKREVGREVVEAIREYEKGSGPGWRR